MNLDMNFHQSKRRSRTRTSTLNLIHQHHSHIWTPIFLKYDYLENYFYSYAMTIKYWTGSSRAADRTGKMSHDFWMSKLDNQKHLWIVVTILLLACRFQVLKLRENPSRYISEGLVLHVKIMRFRSQRVWIDGRRSAHKLQPPQEKDDALPLRGEKRKRFTELGVRISSNPMTKRSSGIISMIIPEMATEKHPRSKLKAGRSGSKSCLPLSDRDVSCSI